MVDKGDRLYDRHDADRHDDVEADLQVRLSDHRAFSLPGMPGVVISSADKIASSCFASSSLRSSTSSRIGLPVFTDSFAIPAVFAYPIYGLSAVATAVLRSSSSRQRAPSASMPSTQSVSSASIAPQRIVDACSAFHAITGIITFSSSWPASAAAQTVASQPITWKQTWFTISAIDGFTLPGMIDEPGCTAGRTISAIPARGPLASSRRSLATFESSTASRRIAPE